MGHREDLKSVSEAEWQVMKVLWQEAPLALPQICLLYTSTYIESVYRAINPYTDFDSYMALAENPDLRVIISNTTEAGIEYLGTEKLTDRPAKSYPAKLTQFLYKRFQTGLNGFILLPCELTDHNADLLRECVNKYAKLWELGEDFEKWLKKENTFCNTLVDRIVTGYPRDEVEELTKQIGYKDNMIDTGEIFLSLIHI